MNENLEAKLDKKIVSEVRPLYLGIASMLIGYLAEFYTVAEGGAQNFLDSLMMTLPMLMAADVYYKKPKSWLDVREAGILFLGLGTGQTLIRYI